MQRYQCEAEVRPWKHWSNGRIVYRDCSNGASVEIDGVKLCMLHAGAIAVQKCLHHDLAKRLEYTPGGSPLCEMKRKF